MRMLHAIPAILAFSVGCSTKPSSPPVDPGPAAPELIDVAEVPPVSDDGPAIPDLPRPDLFEIEEDLPPDPGRDCTGDACGCTPDCAGKDCGDDGCGGVCGTCAAASCDGLKWTPAEACVSGTCQPAKTLDCTDGNACTDDACDPQTGCSHATSKDGTACLAGGCVGKVWTKPGFCKAGICTGGGGFQECEDGEPCTDDACDPVTGCSYTKRADGATCKAAECVGMIWSKARTCQSGLCTGGGALQKCDDGDPCTADTCEPVAGCGFKKAPDGTLCLAGTCNGPVWTKPKTCKAGSCSGGGGMQGCNDADPCTTDLCDPLVGCQHPGGAHPCDDGDPCTSDSCNPAKGCEHSSTPDGTPCLAGSCKDGVWTKSRICVAGHCAGAGGTQVCDDGNACTVNACDPSAGCSFPVGSGPCDDGNACTTGDTCSGGSCQPKGTLDCDDGEACTQDSCDPKSGCTHQPIAGCCGKDDCGGACGPCSGGKVCQDGHCVCAPDHHQECCGAALCWVDSCGVPGAKATECPYGCADGKCLACPPACAGRDCGPDGCGGTCGACKTGQTCDKAGKCVCTPQDHTQCCGNAVCWVDSCDVQGDKLLDCAFGCNAGKCKDCTPACGGKMCGDDGCGGSCGTCTGGKVCQAGSCTCLADQAQACCGNAICEFDSCGNPGTKLKDCPYGCSQAACKPCTTACGGKSCGDDGCGGSCGTCGGGKVCQAGVCACLPNQGQICCGNAVCWLDSCQKMGAKVQDCPYGCASGACKSCPASCAGKTCGDDGCGGSCGTCPAQQQCDGSKCVPKTEPCGNILGVGCCDGAVNRYCTTDKTLGSEDCGNAANCGWCASCQPPGYYCGYTGTDPDGRFLPKCPGSTCTPKDHKGCLGSAVYWFDSCGGSGAKAEDCALGCKAGACQVNPCGTVPPGGVCSGSQEVSYCVLPPGGNLPSVEKVACASYETCQVSGDVASCQPKAGWCNPGAEECVSASLGRYCDDQGAWKTASCLQCSASPAGVLCPGTLAMTTWSGQLVYEAREPDAAMTDWKPGVFQTAAPFVLMISWRYDPSVKDWNGIDAAMTDADGKFTIHVPATPLPEDQLGAVLIQPSPLGLGNGISFAVAKPGVPDGQQAVSSIPADSGDYWNWAWTVSDLGASGGMLNIPADQGSGAMRIYDFLRFAYFNTYKIMKTEGRAAIAWMRPNTSWTCGNCAWKKPVSYKGFEFGQQVFFSALASDESYWSDPVTAHEFGHWAMDSYGFRAVEGGTHYVDCPTFPGQAWSEGWATWFSSVARDSPVYYDKDNGSFWWFDIAKRKLSYSGGWPTPVPANGLLQPISENEVSAMMWSLTDKTEPALGQPANKIFWDALASPRMTGQPFGRGYTWHTWKVDNCNKLDVADQGVSIPMFADFLDALRCLGMPAGTIDAATQPTKYYPYPSATPICASAKDPSAPVSLAVDGPASVVAGTEVVILARFERVRPELGPVELGVSVPAGATLVQGEAVETIDDPVATRIERVYRLWLDRVPDRDFVVSIDLGGDGWGIHGRQAYRFGRPEPQLPIPVRDPRPHRIGGHELGHPILVR